MFLHFLGIGDIMVSNGIHQTSMGDTSERCRPAVNAQISTLIRAPRKLDIESRIPNPHLTISPTR